MIVTQLFAVTTYFLIAECYLLSKRKPVEYLYNIWQKSWIIL